VNQFVRKERNYAYEEEVQEYKKKMTEYRKRHLKQ